MNQHDKTKKSSDAKSEYLEIRVSAREKQAFERAADVAGIALSAWARERLRRIAVRELEDIGEIAAFVNQKGGL